MALLTKVSVCGVSPLLAIAYVTNGDKYTSILSRSQKQNRPIMIGVDSCTRELGLSGSKCEG